MKIFFAKLLLSNFLFSWGGGGSCQEVDCRFAPLPHPHPFKKKNTSDNHANYNKQVKKNE